MGLGFRISEYNNLGVAILMAVCKIASHHHGPVIDQLTYAAEQLCIECCEAHFKGDPALFCFYSHIWDECVGG